MHKHTLKNANKRRGTYTLIDVDTRSQTHRDTRHRSGGVHASKHMYTLVDANTHIHTHTNTHTYTLTYT
jgi:hypothetical protein